MTPALYLAYGGAGAFVYAGPRFLVSLQDADLTLVKIVVRLADLIMGVATGALFTMIIGPYAASFAHITKPDEYGAFAGIVGMVSNPIGPALIQAASSGIIGRVNGLFGVKTDAS